MLGFGVVPALLLAVVVAPIDAVVLRDVLSDPRMPAATRRALSVEAGTNDLIVLPALLVLVAVAGSDLGDAAAWLRFLGEILVVAPSAGFLVGAGGSGLMRLTDARFGVPREYQSLYGVGLVFAGFAVGQAVGNSGFLAAFTAGLAVTVTNNELCDCFLDFGHVLVEMLMLLAFVLFGALLSTLVPDLPLAPSLVFAGTVLVVARPVPLALLLRLPPARLDAASAALVAWFGPRGLTTLLFGLLVVTAGVDGAERLLAVAGVVAIASAVAHGTTAAPLVAWYERRPAHARPQEQHGEDGGPEGQRDHGRPALITPVDLARRLRGAKPPVVLDVRDGGDTVGHPGVPGSVRLPADQAADFAAAHCRHHDVVVYCATPREATSRRVAEQLRAHGLPAVALRGGVEAWHTRRGDDDPDA